MADQPTQRRLAAILAADVAGYTTLMERDTEGTVAAWKAACLDVIDPGIDKFGGRIVKHTGDGFMAEFSTVQDAVSCAVALQKDLIAGSLDFRMGVNLGDITDDGVDIHGEGVNVAARLEAIADPNGICISGEAHSLVRNRVDVPYRDLGEHKVKHVTHPVRVFAIDLDAEVTAPQTVPKPRAEFVTQSDKPAIAVLPFENMSNDPEQEYFADGLTEDILTQLSRFSDLFVISRNSTFTYKGKATKVQDVARDLGVQYVVEGSVRKAGERVRVTVQLIDGANGRHVWAEKYDRNLEDIFAIQDEITAAITATLPGRVEADTRDRSRSTPTDNMRAYECVLAGKVLHHRSNFDDNVKALRILDRAIEMDPGYVHARAWRACVLMQARVYDWVDNSDAVFQEVLNELNRALALDESDADVHRVLAAVSIARDDLDQAELHQEKALNLNPNYDLVVVQQGELLTWMGRPEEGVEWIKKAMQLNPFFPKRFQSHLGRAFFVSRCYKTAIESFRRTEAPDSSHHAFLASCFTYLGKSTEAAEFTQAVLRQEPGFSVESHMELQHYLLDSDHDHHRDGLLKSGLPL